MSTFVAGIWIQPKILKAINVIQLHESTGNGNIGEQQQGARDLLLTMKRYLLLWASFAFMEAGLVDSQKGDNSKAELELRAAGFCRKKAVMLGVSRRSQSMNSLFNRTWPASKLEPRESTSVP